MKYPPAGEEVLETLGFLVSCVFISVLNGLEWVAVLQDELSACLIVTGGGAGDPGSSRFLCSVFVLNGLEWVVACRMNCPPASW